MGVLNWIDFTISPVRSEYRSTQQYGGVVLKNKHDFNKGEKSTTHMSLAHGIKKYIQAGQ